MKYVITAALCLLTLCLFAQQNNYKNYISKDNSYRIGIPSAWIPDTKVKNYELNLEDKLPVYENPNPRFYLVVEPAKVLNTSIRDLVNKIDKPTNTKDEETSFVNINNHEWYRKSFVVSQTKKIKIKAITIETYYNNVFYRIGYSSAEKDFDTNLALAKKCMYSMLFLKKEATINTRHFPIDSINKYINNFTGTYLNDKQIGNSIQKISIKGENNGYNATIDDNWKLLDGTNAQMLANLSIDSINSAEIFLSVNDIISITGENNVFFEKSKFILKKMNGNLNGSLKTVYQGDQFISSQVVFTNEKSSKKSTIPESPAPEIIKDPVPVKSETNQVSASTPDTKKVSALNYINCGGHYNKDNFIDEKLNLQNCGNKKVVRKGKNTLSILLNSGKTLSLTDKDNGEQSISYTYIGYSEKLKSYLIEEGYWESAAIMAYNSTTGQKININGEVVFSPDEKLILTIDSQIGEDYPESYSFLNIFSVSNNKLTEVYSLDTYEESLQNDKPGWGVISAKWLNKDLIEIERFFDMTIPKNTNGPTTGKAWLQNYNGKWLLTSIKDVLVVPSVGVDPESTGFVKSGTASPDELGRILFNAMKKNDKKTWRQHTGGDQIIVYEAFEKLRSNFEANGISNWANAQYSRVTYKPVKNINNSTEKIYQYFNIEFTYGKDFIGVIRGHLNNGHFYFERGKYYLSHNLENGAVFRREEYYK